MSKRLPNRSLAFVSTFVCEIHRAGSYELRLQGICITSRISSAGMRTITVIATVRVLSEITREELRQR